MTLKELCKIIDLQPEVTQQVIHYYNSLDFSKINPLYSEINSRQSWDNGCNELKNILGEDPDGFKILTCMLSFALNTHAVYEEKGISEEIYTATMKIFTRFIKEHMDGYGSYRFTWAWWVPRQISCNEFRIGELEYETVDMNGCKSISIHIPSDAVMSTVNLRKSYLNAHHFFEKYYPDYKDVDMCCDSWLLSPMLEKLLPENSNILRFQKAFILDKVEYDTNYYMNWVYKRDDIPLAELPENTSLQRKMKEHILNGGKVGSASGKLITDPFC